MDKKTEFLYHDLKKIQKSLIIKFTSIVTMKKLYIGLEIDFTHKSEIFKNQENIKLCT